MMFRLKAENTGSTAGFNSYTCVSSENFLTSLRVSMLTVSFKNFPSLTFFELIAASNFLSWLWPESFKPLVQSVICV